MQSQYVFKLDDIEGEFEESQHRGWISVISWSWGQSQLGFQAGTGAGAGRVEIEDFHLVLPPSKAVPMLMSACATGKIFREAQVHGGWEPDSTAFLKVRLLDVMVSSFQTSALSGEAVLQVSIALNFEKIEMEIAPRDISGKLGAAVSAGWDRKRNRRS